MDGTLPGERLWVGPPAPTLGDNTDEDEDEDAEGAFCIGMAIALTPGILPGIPLPPIVPGTMP